MPRSEDEVERLAKLAYHAWCYASDDSREWKHADEDHKRDWRYTACAILRHYQRKPAKKRQVNRAK